MKFKVTSEPVIIAAAGKNKNATNIAQRYRQGNKERIGNAHKKHQDKQHQEKPITIEFTRSLNEVRVARLWSPVITTFRFDR